MFIFLPKHYIISFHGREGNPNLKMLSDLPGRRGGLLNNNHEWAEEWRQGEALSVSVGGWKDYKQSLQGVSPAPWGLTYHFQKESSVRRLFCVSSSLSLGPAFAGDPDAYHLCFPVRVENITFSSPKLLRDSMRSNQSLSWLRVTANCREAKFAIHNVSGMSIILFLRNKRPRRNIWPLLKLPQGI